MYVHVSSITSSRRENPRCQYISSLIKACTSGALPASYISINSCHQTNLPDAYLIINHCYIDKLFLYCIEFIG